MRPYRIAVFCSAATEMNEIYYREATEFAKGLARKSWELVYGGGARGLMGHFADETLKCGGFVRGAITEDLAAGPEIAHRGLTELVIVKDLFARKGWMMDKADGFAIFPGGLGTLDEALEVLTWRTLKCHQKPIVFVNVGQFWQHQLKVFEYFAREGMIHTPKGLKYYDVCDSSREALAVFDAEFSQLEKSGTQSDGGGQAHC